MRLITKWDRDLLQTAELQPKGSFSVLIDFASEPGTDDGGLPDAISRSLAAGLTAFGTAAGRWLDGEQSIPSSAQVFRPPRRTYLPRILTRAFRAEPVAVVITRSPEVTIELLCQGWDMQQQALLIHGGSDAAFQEEALEMLSMRRNWSEFTLAAMEQVALVAPAVDGDYILIAASTPQCLTEVLSHLAASFRAEGYSFPNGA